MVLTPSIAIAFAEEPLDIYQIELYLSTPSFL